MQVSSSDFCSLEGHGQCEKMACQALDSDVETLNSKRWVLGQHSVVLCIAIFDTLPNLLTNKNAAFNKRYLFLNTQQWH